MNELSVIQMIIQGTVEAMKLTEKSVGTVVSVSPLSIQREQNGIPIPEKALILADAVRAKTASVQGGAGGTVVINEGLKVGDKVLMLRVEHGNAYIVLSKIP